MAHLACPKCRTSDLKEAVLRERPLGVHACPTCHGLWISSAALAEVVRDHPRVLTPPRRAAPSNYLCPHCHLPMVSFRYLQSYVTIDLCTTCRGVWLDDRELQEIAAVRRHHRNEGTLEEYPPLEGAKGALINLVNRAIAALSDFTDD